MSVNPFPLVEMAVKELIETKMTGAQGRVGGDLSYDGQDEFYVWLGLIPGGRADQIEGRWNLDIDVFATDYSAAMQRALDLEAVLVGPRHVTSVLRLDYCTQNLAPNERPWEADGVFRIGSTYTFTARRSG